MFTKLTTLKKFSNDTISIDGLVSLIKNNPNKDLINYLRSIEYKSKEYNDLKLKLSCITPHGTFNSLLAKDLISLSGYLYYDIDGFTSEKELDDTINRLNDTFPITLICKSVGGRGISFLIKIDDTMNELNDTFISLHKYVGSLLIDNGFTIDNSAGGLVRKMIISSDNNIIYNKEVSLCINKVSFQSWASGNIGESNKTVELGVKERIRITPNDTLPKIIPLIDLYKRISIETTYKNEIDGFYKIEDSNYYRILIPKIIKDGMKNKLYTRIINALVYINNNITIEEVYSYLYYVNQTAAPQMNNYKMWNLIKSIYTNIIETGEIRIKTRTKKIHFNKNMKIEKRTKQSIGAKVSGAVKTNKTIELIEEAKMQMASKNIEPTQKKVSEYTGLSIATIKRNWNKQKTIIEEMEFDIKLEEKDANSLLELSWDEFLKD